MRPGAIDAQTDVRPDAAPALASVTVGSSVACFLRQDGTLLCWGLNQYGGLGDGTIGGASCPSGNFNYACRATPAPVAGLTNVIAADAGEFHVCAVRSDGTLWCWGQNGKGQLGHTSGDATCSDAAGTTVACSPTPTQVATFPLGTKVTQVACGLYHTCALTSTGEVYCFGDNTLGALGAPVATISSATPLRVTGLSSAAVEVKVGIDHSRMSCARLMDSTVWCWGQGDLGALGRETTAGAAAAPGPVVDQQINPLAGVASLQAGGSGACVLKNDGTAWCWGGNAFGILGNGSTDNLAHPLPQRVVLALPTGLVALARKDYIALALDPSGNVWAWGRNNFAQLGDGTVAGDTGCGATCKSTPVKLPGLGDVARIAIGEANGFAIKRDGSVWGWGANDSGTAGHAPSTAGDGACGSASTNTFCNPTPTRILGLP